MEKGLTIWDQVQNMYQSLLMTMVLCNGRNQKTVFEQSWWIRKWNVFKAVLVMNTLRD